MIGLMQRHLFVVMFVLSVAAHASAVFIGQTATSPPVLQVQAGRASISLRSAASAGPKPSAAHKVEKPKEAPPPPPPPKRVEKKEQLVKNDGPKIARPTERLVPSPAEQRPAEKKPDAEQKPVEEPKTNPSKETPQVEADRTSAGSQGSAGSRGANVVPQGYSNNKAPLYPPEALQAYLEGTVVLWIHVDARGRVGRVHVHKSSGYQVLDDAAVDAAKEYQYDPARRGASAVPHDVLQSFPFSIKNR